MGGYLKNSGSPWIHQRSLFCKILMDFVRMVPVNMYRPNLKFVALPVPEVIAIEVLGGGCEPPFLGKRRPYAWVAVAPFERALVSSYKPSIVTFSLGLSLRVSGILPLVLQHATFPHLGSPNFPHFLLGGCIAWPLSYEERKYWANCPCN